MLRYDNIYLPLLIYIRIRVFEKREYLSSNIQENEETDSRLSLEIAFERRITSYETLSRTKLRRGINCDASSRGNRSKT